MMGDVVNISKDVLNSSLMNTAYGPSTTTNGKPARRTRDSNMSFDIS